MNLYARQDVPAGTLVAVSVSGTAPPEANTGADQSQQGGQQGRDTQQGGGETAGVSIQAVPGRLDGLKWYLIAGFAVLFTMGAILLGRKPVVAVAGGAPEMEEVPPVKQKKLKPSAYATPPAPTVSVGPSNGAASLAEVDAAIGTSLDALKEGLVPP